MTRLVETDVRPLPELLADYDRELTGRTGTDLVGVACHAVDVDQEQAWAALAATRLAAVTLTCGRGEIGGFARAVAAIGSHLGADSRAMAATDAAGLAEAVTWGAEVILIADDETFTALNPGRRRATDNSEMTGRVYAAGLELLARKNDREIRNRPVLVLGCGPVGLAGCAELLARGASVTVADIDPARLETVGRSRPELAGRVAATTDAAGAMAGHDLILDATPAADALKAEMVKDSTLYVCPGVPCGATAGAVERLGGRMLHDPLQLGVAAMIIDALCG